MQTSSMFRQVRSGGWNLELCPQTIRTPQTASVGLHLQPQMSCRGQPALQFSHLQLYCSLQSLMVICLVKMLCTSNLKH